MLTSGNGKVSMISLLLSAVAFILQLRELNNINNNEAAIGNKIILIYLVCTSTSILIMPTPLHHVIWKEAALSSGRLPLLQPHFIKTNRRVSITSAICILHK
jgi:hypothetical protein